MPLILGRKIFTSMPDGFTSAFVTGPRGIGKSTYSLHVAFEIYKHLGYDNKAAWEKALKSIHFSIPEVVKFLGDLDRHNQKSPIMIWDDLRVHASGSIYHSDPKLVAALIGLLDTVRTVLNGLILTAPSTDNLLGFLRSYDDHLVRITYDSKGGGYRIAKGYIWKSLPSGKKLIYAQFNDYYRCHLPDPVYKEYMGRRKAALRLAIRKLKKVDDTDEEI